jgi:hypothetical protein
MEDQDLTARGKSPENFAYNLTVDFYYPFSVFRFPFSIFHSIPTVFFRRKVLHFLFAI